jgi:hypothetical protein
VASAGVPTVDITGVFVHWQLRHPPASVALAVSLAVNFGTAERPWRAGFRSFGDVVLVPFLFTDQTASKKRPIVFVEFERPRVSGGA